MRKKALEVGSSTPNLALREALLRGEKREEEERKYGGVSEADFEARTKRRKGLMGGIGGLPPSIRAKLESADQGERIDFEDPRIAGRTSWRGSSEERRKQKEEREGKSIPFPEEQLSKKIDFPRELLSRKSWRGKGKELGGESLPFTEEMKKEMGGESIPDQYRPDIIRDGRMSWRGKEKELGGESIDLSDPEISGVRDVDKEAAMDMADTEYAIDMAAKKKRD